MTRSSRFVLAAFVAVATASGAMAQQQWGPPAQSKLYHDASHTPTYMSYNTATTTQRTAPAPAVVSARTVTAAKPVVRRHTTARRTSTNLQ